MCKIMTYQQILTFIHDCCSRAFMSGLVLQMSLRICNYAHISHAFYLNMLLFSVI